MPSGPYKKKLISLVLELIEVQMVLYIVHCSKFNKES